MERGTGDTVTHRRERGGTGDTSTHRHPPPHPRRRRGRPGRARALAGALALAAAAGARAGWLPPEHARGGLAGREAAEQLGGGEGEAGGAHAVAATASAAERRITLPLDHGDPGAGTFEGRYFVNATAYDASAGPIFVLMGGEGPVSEKYFQGLVGVLAAKYAGLAVALEHRFYGDSVPGRDLGTANLRYLTVAQALADAAATIRAVKAEYGSPATQVFTVGGSYSGALSAYMRMAHPDVTDGSLASSGVVNAIFDFYQFDVHIHNVLAPPCREAWRATVRLMDAELAEGRGAALKARFGAQALTDDDFRYMTADAAAMAAQYGHKDVLCRAMQVGEETGDRLVVSTCGRAGRS